MRGLNSYNKIIKLVLFGRNIPLKHLQLRYESPACSITSELDTH